MVDYLNKDVYDPSAGGGKGSTSAFQAGMGAMKSAQQGKQPKSPAPKPPAPGNDVRFQIGQAGLAGAPTANELGNTLWPQKVPQAKKGGRVAKGGLVLVHRGELIVPAKHRRKGTSGKQRTITKA